MADELKPYSYNEWLSRSGLAATDDINGYSKYLVKWYEDRKSPRSTLRQDYIQLLKDLNFLFQDDARDRFLASIDFNNEEELINSLPYFTQKIKELVKEYTDKRESVKRSKLKYNLSSSLRGVETLLYEYILRSYTKKGNLIPIPYKELGNILPQLRNVNDTFYIEIEELYDKSNYFDQSPSINVSNYVNSTQLLNSFPYKGNFNQNQLLGMLSAAIKPRIANNPLSDLFLRYLYIDGPGSINEYDYINATNHIAANEKYLGNNLYGLTAIKSNPSEIADYVVSLPFETGNNWFYWPSGDKVYSVDIIDNIYYPLDINKIEWVASGATGGGTYQESDLIFTDKRGYIEGAWLMGPRDIYSKKTVSFNVDSNERRQFIWPYPGFQLAKITNQWKGHATNDDSNKYFYFLSDQQKTFILNKYFTSPLPSVSSLPLYLNETNFHLGGSLAGNSTADSDVVIKQKTTTEINPLYNDSQGSTEASFLYRFQHTNIPITRGVNNILWPIKKFEADDDNLPITVTKNFCLPVELAYIDVVESFKGAIAGLNADSSDIIYKLDKRDGAPIEAAWLKASSITDLNTQEAEIPVYTTKPKPEYCAQYLDGGLQSGIYTKIESGQKTSFIWGDVDTPVDEVIKFINHQDNCPYKNESTNLYNDQDYLNPFPLRDQDLPWSKCNCRSVNYSPIGHKGSNVLDYGGTTDFIFADPQGVAEDFSFNSWRDTRGFDYTQSPQFAFYRLDNSNKDVIGWGSGSWKPSSGNKMILKTGRRYTYYRAHLKTLTNTTPKMVLHYTYKNPSTFCINLQNFDLVILVDLSNSQKYNLDITKKIIESLIKNRPSNVQIGIVAFNSFEYRCSYLSENPDLEVLYKQLDDFGKDYTTYRTNIYDALVLAKTLLTTTITQDNKTSIIDFNRLCHDVNATIVAAQKVPVLNMPQQGGQRRILIISDGEETYESTTGFSLNYSKELKRDFAVQIDAIDIGLRSKFNTLMENMASPNKYYNLQKHISLNDDFSIDRIIKNLIYKINNCRSLDVQWTKLVRNSNGEWIEDLNNTMSDMKLLPGDHILYVHRDGVEYSSPYNQYVNFNMPAVNFNLKIKLRGWDYATNTFKENTLEEYSGARPFWAKAYVDPDKNNNFDKGAMYLGGHIRWLDYLPIEQPDVSDMVLQHGDYIEYVRNKPEKMKVTQTVPFVERKTNYQWNKLEFLKQYSNLNNLFKYDKIDYIVKPTFEKSDLLIEGFYEFKPVKYNYYARNAFTLSEELFLINKCIPTYSVLASGMVLEAEAPYKHLDNVNYPTIAVLPYTHNFTSKKKTGKYLLPHTFGVSHYGGKGYTMELDEVRINQLETQKVEKIFLDPNKYGPITLGLSQHPNKSPVKVSTIDNRWMMVPYGTGEKSGAITNTQSMQKFTAYQSNYEVYGINHFGVSLQTDGFQFHDAAQRWTGSGQNFRGEINSKTYLDRLDRQLTDLGVITNWKMDLFGNNYALYKSNQDANYIETNISSEEALIKAQSQLVKREKLSSNIDPQDREEPNSYENLAYNSREQDFLDFVIGEE
jgi:hypothetical protein